MLAKSRPSTNNNLLQLLQNSQNPQALINQMILKNPQINNLINQYGNGDPKVAFYEYARRTGQNPEQILETLKNIKNKQTF